MGDLHPCESASVVNPLCVQCGADRCDIGYACSSGTGSSVANSGNSEMLAAPVPPAPPGGFASSGDYKAYLGRYDAYLQAFETSRSPKLCASKRRGRRRRKKSGSVASSVSAVSSVTSLSSLGDVDTREGYCYLKLFQSRYVDRARQLLGSEPTVEALLLRPMTEFRLDESIGMSFTADGKMHCGVSGESAWKLLSVTARSECHSWVSGTLGARLSTVNFALPIDVVSPAMSSRVGATVAGSQLSGGLGQLSRAFGMNGAFTMSRFRDDFRSLPDGLPLSEANSQLVSRYRLVHVLPAMVNLPADVAVGSFYGAPYSVEFCERVRAAVAVDVYFDDPSWVVTREPHESSCVDGRFAGSHSGVEFVMPGTQFTNHLHRSVILVPPGVFVRSGVVVYGSLEEPVYLHNRSASSFEVVDTPGGRTAMLLVLRADCPERNDELLGGLLPFRGRASADMRMVVDRADDVVLKWPQRVNGALRGGSRLKVLHNVRNPSRAEDHWFLRDLSKLSTCSALSSIPTAVDGIKIKGRLDLIVGLTLGPIKFIGDYKNCSFGALSPCVFSEFRMDKSDEVVVAGHIWQVFDDYSYDDGGASDSYDSILSEAF